VPGAVTPTKEPVATEEEEEEALVVPARTVQLAMGPQTGGYRDAPAGGEIGGLIAKPVKWRGGQGNPPTVDKTVSDETANWQAVSPNAMMGVGNPRDTDNLDKNNLLAAIMRGKNIITDVKVLTPYPRKAVDPGLSAVKAGIKAVKEKLAGYGVLPVGS
jgi:hypothetical protein